VQKETFVFFLGNKIKFSPAFLVFGSRSMVALYISANRSWLNSINKSLQQQKNFMTS